ncbi:hypothetical protein MXB_2343, partial [Myxobolus squamalis]
MASSTLVFNVARRVFNKFKSSEIPASTVHSSFDIEFSEEKEPEKYLENIKKRFSNPNCSSYSKSNENSKKDDKLVSRPQFLPPKFEIFPSRDLTYNWEMSRNIGPGLNNAGNTCFLNSANKMGFVRFVLCQNYFVPCKIIAINLFSLPILSTTLDVHIIKIIIDICGRMRNGRQEDAHEFLVSLMDSLKQHFSTDIKQLDRFSRETHMIDHIFGGWMRGTVTCLTCQHESTTFDPLLDINLDIENSSNVNTSIYHYFTPQRISGSTYLCPKCKKRVVAKKKVDIEKCPKFLIIQLKRFHFDGKSYSKNSKHINFYEELDITPYVLNGDESKYSLYGVIVHQGSTCSSGHYYAYAKSQHGIWSQLNDSSVSATGVKRLLSDSAYLLFYQKVDSTTRSSSHESSYHQQHNSNNKNQVHHSRSMSHPVINRKDTVSSTTSLFKIFSDQSLKMDKNSDHFRLTYPPVARWNEKN